MLKLFGAGKPDHPMADPKEAKRILEALPPVDVKALEELSHWLESVSTAGGFRPADRAQLLVTVDEAAQVRARKVSREYFAATRPSRYLENLMWTQLHEYWRHAALAWARVVDESLQGKGDAKSLPLFTVRAMRAAAQQIKWQHLRYGPIDTAVWGVLNRLYGVAETRGFAEQKVALFDRLGGETSAKGEFLKAAMFSAVSPDGLLPREIELAERLVGELSPAYVLAREQARELLFWTDLAKPMAPQRAIKAMPEVPSVRCFGPGNAVGTLEVHIDKTHQSRAVPSALALAGDYDYEMVLEVMKHLRLHWDLEPPERRHPRHPVKSRIAVINGFTAALEALGGQDALDFDNKASEAWIVENVSAGGFGAVVPQVKGDWLRVGALLAMQPDGGKNWIAGVVRRVSKVTNTEARVGIETLSRAPMAMKFRVGVLGEHPGLLLPAQNLGAGEVIIVLPANVYSRGLNLEARFAGKDHVYMPVGTPEKGEDYEMLRFRELVRES